MFLGSGEISNCRKCKEIFSLDELYDDFKCPDCHWMDVGVKRRCLTCGIEIFQAKWCSELCMEKKNK